MADISTVRLPDGSEHSIKDTTARGLAADAGSTASAALSAAMGALVFDTDYVIASGVATFSAHVWRAGEEVTTEYPATAFEWSLRLGTASSATALGTGRTMQVALSALGYGGHVICTFTTDE
ncbi:MAG: hypothetical protein IJ092_07045 [Atopobiaceae bacterium]|nr:hypothetical protein [Atopobiaceae bacterium]